PTRPRCQELRCESSGKGDAVSTRSHPVHEVPSTMRGLTPGIVCCMLLLTGPGTQRIWADEVPSESRAAIQKGLAWVAQQQQRDGHWEASGGQYPTTMTALAGMALLMEGSTLRDGKYSSHLRKAVDWLMERSQRNGLIGNPNNPTEAARYMYGHGFGLLFLAQVYG